jgi:hypothetical protein
VGSKISQPVAPHPSLPWPLLANGLAVAWRGGFSGNVYLNTGGRYNPNTDSWTATSLTSAPNGRYAHTAIWTSSEMIVWGGANDTSFFNTGGRYNPGTDSWTATGTTGAPDGRWLHTAVWTDSEMIVWGRVLSSPTGERYDPNTDSWTATSTTGCARCPRTSHGSMDRR